MSILDKLPLDGAKTFLGATIAMLAVAVPAAMSDPVDWATIGTAVGVWLGALGLIHKGEKGGILSSSKAPKMTAIERPAAGAAVLFGLALVLAGCGSIPGTGGSAGAPMPATNLAQTARDQAAVPGQAYGGANNMWFASQNSSDVMMKLLEIASEKEWSPAQIVDGLKATNGAPENVTISAGTSIQGGNADNAGAGTSGASGLAGSGTIARPQ